LPVEAFDRSGNNKLALGQLLAADNQIDTTTGTLKLKSQFANTDGALFVNQFVNVRMLMETLHSIPVIPSAAVQTGEKGSFVYVLKDDQTVSVRPVKLGVVQGENVAVMEGLKAQELVVIDGTDKLREGAKVKRVTAGGSPPEPPTEDKGSKRKRDK
jgi:multidrug efflux system membrane fusion protein